MEAKIMAEYINLSMVYRLSGEVVAETDCRDFEAFQKLPAAIEYSGYILGKTGWNSDTGRACYKSGVLLGKRR